MSQLQTLKLFFSSFSIGGRKSGEGWQEEAKKTFKCLNETPAKIHVLLQMDWKVILQR